ncbi:F-box domain protein [Aspergillus sclerotioniger CBS 115572]|uniref:F-box domain protein n=1 Tax=Aspergillus sclerotioniger CBS 115572 TaxID=1450535 RepID=A0A317VD69_9EURO|nr:F-box domain protein [Aspergillus sclerotioniger CBS 115572]PWY69830.1 F-box domain protein [Aspergillus sclerotioniger CBS 115572]
MANDSSATQQIIELFTQLNTNSARQDAYHRILDQLKPHEWRDVRTRINQRAFQKDILGQSPPEVAVQIAQYLDLSEIHVVQRVSRKWHLLLSSELIRGAVYQHYTGCGVHVTEDQFILYSKQRLRLERGLPTCKLQGLTRSSPYGSSLACQDYTNGRHAWLEGDTHIIVYDLWKHTAQRFCTENRESFRDMRLSESMVVAISVRGYCHTWNLETEEYASFRIPALHFRAFVVRGLKVALGFANPLAVGDESIIYWDMGSRIARSIQVEPNLALVGLHQTTNSLTTLHLQRESHTRYENGSTSSGHHDSLCVVKYKVDGHERITGVASETLRLPFLSGIDWNIEILHDISNDASGRLAAFSCQPLPSAVASTTPRYILVATHDPQTDKVYMHGLRPEDTPYLPLCIAAVDRNLLYYVKNDRGKPAIWISDPASRNPHRPAKAMDPELPREATSRVYSYASRFTLRGDRDFILMVDEIEVKVWRFGDMRDHQCSL